MLHAEEGPPVTAGAASGSLGPSAKEAAGMPSREEARSPWELVGPTPETETDEVSIEERFAMLFTDEEKQLCVALHESGAPRGELIATLVRTTGSEPLLAHSREFGRGQVLDGDPGERPDLPAGIIGWCSCGRTASRGGGDCVRPAASIVRRRTPSIVRSASAGGRGSNLGGGASRTTEPSCARCGAERPVGRPVLH